MNVKAEQFPKHSENFIFPERFEAEKGFSMRKAGGQKDTCRMEDEIKISLVRYH